MENGTQMTLEEFMPEISQKQTSGASDSLVRISQLQESSLDLLETARHSFSELCTFLDNSKKKRDPLTYSLRTLKICCLLMEDGISPDFSLKWIGGGYDAEWQVLNSKFFEVPQNRERCFIIGHLRGRSTAEIFPVEGTNGADHLHRMTSTIGHRDGYRRNMQVFDPEGVTETLDTGQGGGRGHYTIEVIAELPYTNGKSGQRTGIYGTDGIAGELLSTMYKEPDRVAIPVLTPDRATKRQNGRRFKEDGEESFTLTGQDRHGVALEVKVKEATKQGYAVARGGRDSVNLSMPGSKTRRGRVGVDMANTLDTSCNQGIFVQISENLTVYAVWYPKKHCYIAIRKLTPKECFRLQGWSDFYFERAQFVSSDSQLYKQAGNGVTVSVIETIARKMQ